MVVWILKEVTLDKNAVVHQKIEDTKKLNSNQEGKQILPQFLSFLCTSFLDPSLSVTSNLA